MVKPWPTSAAAAGAAIPAARPRSESETSNLVLVIGKPSLKNELFPSPVKAAPFVGRAQMAGGAPPRRPPSSVIVGALAMLAEVEAFALDVRADPEAGEQFGDGD